MESTPSIPQPVQVVYDDDLSNAKRATGAVCLRDIVPHNVAWLWPGRIPLGNVTLLVSDPGVGKSLVALDIAARVSTGAPWPDSQPSTLNSQPSSVLLINIEDHFHNTIRPRLDALGADCSRIMAWTYVPGDLLVEGPRLFALTRDLDRLSTLVCAMRDCRLVILDPITAFLGDSSDQLSADVWKLLSALASLARKRNFAVLAVSHFRKKEGAAIHRALGSLAFIALARTAWTIAKDCADAKKRLLLPLKNNLAPDANGLAFTIDSTEENRAPIIRWLPDTIEARADVVLASNRQPGRPDDERRYAIDWLRTRLLSGESPVREIRKDADAHGIAYTTLRRAFRDLCGQAVRQGGSTGHWNWKLPDKGAQNPGGEFWAPLVPAAKTAAEPAPQSTLARHLTPDT